MEKIFCIIIGYFFGCFQSAYIIIKHFEGVDIRKIGSGNAGMTNTYINYGKLPALLVLFCDIMKTILSAIICTVLVPHLNSITAISLSCLGTALGHNFPFWLGFKGGKGVAVAVATSLVLDVRIFLISILTAALFSLLVKSATYGSYTFAIMLFVSTAVFGYDPIVIMCILIQSILITVLHVKVTGVEPDTV